MQFLARLAQGQLPYPPEMQVAVREITRLEAGDGWVLYGKTGWTAQKQPFAGWWVELSSKIYSFALNMAVPDAADLPKRFVLAKGSLRARGLLK